MPFLVRISCACALISLLATAAPGAEVVVPFTSGEAAVVDGGGGQVELQIPGFSSFASPGDPALPYADTYVLLPPNANVRTARLEIKNAVEEKIPGSFDVAPTPPLVAYVDGRTIESWGSGKQIEDGRDVLVYGVSQPYPKDYATLDFDGRLGPYLLVPVRFWPYRYNPVTRDLVHLASADVAIVFETMALAQAAVGDPGEIERLQQLAVNWRQAESWYGVRVAASSPPPPLTPLAIITTSSIVSASTKLASFVTHKINMGFSVTVAAESSWGGGTGDTAAENLRTWLKANYATKARYAILIGNPNPSSGDVPMKMLWPRHGAGDGYEEAPSDYYYADLTGNWDLNGNGYYGEEPGDFGSGGVDRIPEVIVGRIPYYGVIADLDKILQKMINYESSPTVGGWVQRMLLPMEPLDSDTPLWQLGEAIRNNVAAPACLGWHRIYEQTYGLNPPPETTPCTESNVQSAWQNGFGFIFWGTHGNSTLAADIFSSGRCQYLNDTTPGFTFQGSCLNGQPEATDNLGYKLLWNGAIGTVSASRVSWYYPGEDYYVGSDSDPGMTYTYALRLAKDRQRCGDALFNMKTGLPRNIWMNHVVFNLYGDPTVAPRWPTTFAIQTTSLPSGFKGQYYINYLQASGGVIPYAWSLQSGSLPPGLILLSSGAISGTPTKSGIYYFTVKVTAGGLSLTRNLSIEVTESAYSFTLNSNPNWTCQGMWAFGQPTGSGSYNHDPTSGHTGNYVYGYNLSGDYANSMTVQYLTTQAFDCSGLERTKLSFWRWLGVESSTYDHATVQVSNDGSSWATVWSNTSTSISDSAWSQQIYDISAVADGQPTVYVRWGMGPTGGSVTYPGWNIDDVEIRGILYESVSNLAAVKVRAENTQAMLQGKIVSAAYQGFFYIQEPGGYQGIRVVWPGSVTEGAPAVLRGALRTTDGEREIVAEGVTQGSYIGPVPPVGIGLRWLGGKDFGTPPAGQRGVSDGIGLNNIGTLVEVWGRITQIGAGYFYVNDGWVLTDGTYTGGEPNIGVRILWPPAGRSSGDFVTVTGVSSGFLDGTKFLRLVVPRRAADVAP